MFEKENIRFYLFTIFATLYIGIAFTSADFLTSPVSNIKDSFILLLQWCVLIAALFSVIYLLSLNKYIFAIVYPLMVFFSSILMYFRYTTGTILTTMILDAAFDNDSKITYELINSGLIITILSSLLIAFLFVYYRIKKVTLNHTLMHLIVAFLLCAGIFNISRIRNPISERIPFNLYFITSSYISQKEEILKERGNLGEIISCGSQDNLQVIFILGESLRADHLGFNGYQRNTTPNLSNEDIISFTNIYSEYTYTNASIPHILTSADSIHPERAYKERSFIDLFKKCGYYTSWLANQESAKTYVYFMNECDTLVFNNINKSTYVFDKWLDEDLLPSFHWLLHNKKQKQLIIMHTIGSHWYYNSHFPNEFQNYDPITKSRIVNSNSPEEMINSYDNTILYTDYFISKVINELKDKNAIVFYLSDHGEALGEEGIWLHAANVYSTHYPACFVWMSDIYKMEYPDKYNAAKKNKEAFFRTDFLFPSILEAAGIESDVVNKSLSIFR